MATIRVVLTKIFDRDYPGFGSFEFDDVSGQTVVIHEKLPVVGVDFWDGETKLPLNVELDCTVVSAYDDYVVIDTRNPHHIEDVHGRFEFRVSPKLVKA